MPSISIRWERRAFKELESLSKQAHQRIVRAVETLRKVPLKGDLLSAEWKGLRRLRVGTYRVIYAFDGETLIISAVRVAHRKDAYRKAFERPALGVRNYINQETLRLPDPGACRVGRAAGRVTANGV